MFPSIYYAISLIILLSLLYFYRFISSHEKAIPSKNWDALFLIFSLVLLVFMRIPSVCYNRELNLDESQALTQAITLAHDPVYGRSVDGTTLGPVNSYFLLVLHALGLPFDYILVRLTALLLIIGSLYFFYRSLQRLTSSVVSRTCFLFVLCFFAATTNFDFVHYSSELTSLLVITSCFFLALKILQSPAVSIGSLGGLGALSGCIIYCKLQAIPIMGMLLLAVFFYAVKNYRWKSIGYLVALGVGFLLPSVLVFGLAFSFRVERYFIDYYFFANLTTYSQLYANMPMNQKNLLQKVLHFFLVQEKPLDFLLFILFTCLAALAAAITICVNRFLRYRQGTFSWEFLLTSMTVFGALFAVIAPGTVFYHHLLLLVFPLTWLTGLSLQMLVDYIPVQRIRVLPLITSGFIIVAVFSANTVVQFYSLPIYHQLINEEVATDEISNVDRNPTVFTFPNCIRLAKSPVSQRISQYAGGSDKMAIWGWNCTYYVETQLMQGVSENHTQRSIAPHGMRHMYLSRYARELLTNKPDVFVDAIGKSSFGFKKPIYRHEYFAEIHQVVKEHYALVDSLDDVRIYIRRDQLLARRAQ